MKAAITQTLLRNLPSIPEGKRYVRIFDTGQPGLILEVQANGGTFYRQMLTLAGVAEAIRFFSMNGADFDRRYNYQIATPLML